MSYASKAYLKWAQNFELYPNQWDEFYNINTTLFDSIMLYMSINDESVKNSPENRDQLVIFALLMATIHGEI